jgi:hypothetical protein
MCGCYQRITRWFLIKCLIYYNNIVSMHLVHELRITQQGAIDSYRSRVITNMKAKVQGFIHAKAGAFASVSEKVRQSLTS